VEFQIWQHSVIDLQYEAGEKKKEKVKEGLQLLAAEAN